MSERVEQALLEEIERTLKRFLESTGISDERKTEVLRELLALALEDAI